MTTVLAAGLIILVGAVFALRRVDIRIVLGLCAAALFLLAGQPTQLFVQLAREMTNDKTVVPICSAMGFAYVVKLTGCDRHLIHLLTAPLRLVQPLLIPGGTSVGYLVNTAIVSQSSTAATVGPVLVPLLRAAEVSLGTAGSLLLLGSSMGGELYNPGAVEIVTLAALTGLEPTDAVRHVAPANLTACITALLVFWWLAVRYERSASAVSEREALHDVSATEDESGGASSPPDEPFRLNAVMALVPLLPLALLFVVPRLVQLPAELTESIRIAAAMVIGTVVAGLAAPKVARQLANAFFEGAGYAYSHVISLIVTAILFTEGIKANGIIEAMVQALSHWPVIAVCASVALPCLLAAITGSGIAPAVAVMTVLAPVAASMGLDPVRTGALIAVSAQLGRTMSPAAAVVIMSATVSGVAPPRLLRRVIPALIAGAGLMLLAALFGLL